MENTVKTLTLNDARVPLEVGARMLKHKLDEELTPDLLQNMDASIEVAIAIVSEIARRLLNVIKERGIQLTEEEEKASRHKIGQYLLLSVFTSAVIKPVMGIVSNSTIFSRATDFPQLTEEIIKEAFRTLQGEYHRLQMAETVEDMRTKVVMKILYAFYFGPNPTVYERVGQGLTSGINVTMKFGAALPALAQRDIPDVELTEGLLMELYQDLYPIIMKIVFFTVPHLVVTEKKIASPQEVLNLLKIVERPGMRPRIAHEHKDFKRIPPPDLTRGPPIGCPAHTAGVQAPTDDSAIRLLFDTCGEILRKAYARGLRK